MPTSPRNHRKPKITKTPADFLAMKVLRKKMNDYDKYWILIRTEDGTSAEMAIKFWFKKFRPLEYELYQNSDTWNSCFLQKEHLRAWRRNVEKYGKTNKPKIRNVEKLVRIDQARDIIRQIQDEMEDNIEECFVLTSRTLGAKMKISHSQANKYLNEVLGKWRTLKNSPLLTDEHKQRRITMAKKFEQYKTIWGEDFIDRVIWTDESNIELFPTTYGRRGIRTHGIEDPKIYTTIRTVKHGPKFMLRIKNSRFCTI